jgi:hypothetical protein
MLAIATSVAVVGFATFPHDTEVDSPAVVQRQESPPPPLHYDYDYDYDYEARDTCGNLGDVCSYSPCCSALECKVYIYDYYYGGLKRCTKPMTQTPLEPPLPAPPLPEPPPESSANKGPAALARPTLRAQFYEWIFLPK